MPMFRKKDEAFFDSWTPEMAYVLGFIFADGSVVTNRRGGCFLELISTDKELIVKLKKMLGSDHVIGTYQPRNLDHKPQYRLQIGSKKWVQILAGYGVVQNKSLILAFPEVPVGYLGHFVRGYFDGDGCVSFGKYWRKDRQKWKWEFTTRFTSGSRDFLNNLWEALSKVTKGGYLYQKNKGFELVFSRADSIALFQFMYHNVISEKYLERKYAVFQKALKIIPMRA
jgi:intein/homing endonuclease